MSLEAQARAKEKAVLLRQEMDLSELRKARQLSQEELAQVLNIGQASVAKLEKRADMYVSTLRRFVEAVGGDLEIVAKFPDHSIPIKHFEDLNHA